jgi:MFS family permease
VNTHAPQTSQFDLLRQRRFLPFFLTQALGAFNDNLFRNALLVMLTYRIAGIDAAQAGLYANVAAALFILPFFLFSAMAGQWAEKYEKARLIRWIKLAEIPIMLLGVLGFHLQSVPFLLGVLFLMGTQSASLRATEVRPDAAASETVGTGRRQCVGGDRHLSRHFAWVPWQVASWLASRMATCGWPSASSGWLSSATSVRARFRSRRPPRRI